MKRLILFFCSITMISCSVLQSSGGGLYEKKFQVQTSSGVVNNDLGTSDLEIVMWQDIPFAQPPVGDLRWRAPRPLNSPRQIIWVIQRSSQAKNYIFFWIN